MADDLRAGRVVIPASELIWRYDTPGGPGGQHANRTASRVELRWYVADSRVPSRLRQLLLSKLGSPVVVSAADSRSQARNRDLALQRLRDLLLEAQRPATPRRATKPTKASQKRRVDDKRRRSEVKRGRGRVQPDD